MIRKLGPGHEELIDKVIPDWSPGCRRMTVSNNISRIPVGPTSILTKKGTLVVIQPGEGYLKTLAQHRSPNIPTTLVASYFGGEGGREREGGHR